MPSTRRSIGTSKRQFDARPDRLDLRDRLYQPRLVSLPAEWPDEQLITQHFHRYRHLVLNQGSEGACTGFGLAAVVNYLRWRKCLRAELEGRKNEPSPDSLLKASPRMLYELAKVYDEWPGEDYEGSSCRGAMKGWHKHGVCTEDFWLYDPKKFTKPEQGWSANAARCPLGAYYRVDQRSIADMQAALLEVGAIFAAAEVHAGWDLKASKILPTIRIKKRDGDAGHAFALVGYTPEGFIVQNSWGPQWGMAGFAVLTYEDWAQNGKDAWVAALGAPMLAGSSTESGARRNEGLANFQKGMQMRTEAVTGLAVGSTGTLATSPWMDDTARDHTIVLGNNGKPQRNHFVVPDGPAAVVRAAFEEPLRWFAALPADVPPRLAIYAHGGLNKEADSIKRISVLGPYFKANGIYPLFITWKTGALESITNMLEDAFSKEDATRSMDSGWLGDARDRAIEAISRIVLVKAIWTEMKENAARANDADGGIALMATALKQLAGQVKNLQVHLVGHSAGSFPLGYLLGRMGKASLKASSLSLFAPACSCQFALDHYQPALQNKVVAPANTWVDLLSDKQELADTVGPYGKSLLYLVSRALEAEHKTPLLGLANAWLVPQPDAKQKADFWNGKLEPSATQWAKFAAQAGVAPNLLDNPKVSNGPGSSINLAHGSFDNDVKVIGALLMRILGSSSLKHPVKDLRGF